MPSVEMTSNENGTVLHLSIDNRILIRRLYDFLDKVFKSSYYRSLIMRYCATLKAAVPGFPQTEEELLPWWEAEYPNAEKVEKTATLELDVVSSGSSENTETVAFGTLTARENTYDFSFEFVNSEEGLSLKAYALETERSRTVSSYTVNLAKHGDDFSVHAGTDSLRAGSASLDLVADGSEISGSFKKDDREYTVTGTRNVSANSADIRIRRVGPEEPEGADFAFAPDQLYIRSFDQDGSVRCSVSSASTYTHLSLLGESVLPGRDYSCDFWAVNTPTGGTLLRYKQSGATGWSPYNAVNMWLRNEPDFTEGEMESTIYNMTDYKSFRFRPGEDGFELEAHEGCRTDREEFDSALVLQKAGNTYTYDVSVPEGDKTTKVAGDLAMDGEKQFVSAAGVVTEEDRQTGEQKQTGRYEFTPRKGIVEDEEGVHTMEVVKDTAEEMVWEARLNDRLTSSFTANLAQTEAGTAFTCSCTKGGETVHSLSVVPLAKEELTPIDESGALVISAETLPALLQQLFEAN